jgi:hypothetical protein
MAEITIVVSLSFDRRGKRRHDRFDARLKDDAEVICAATRQPLLDTSRVLLARGFNPSTVLCMAHSHAPTVVTLRSPIGVAAQYDVMGSAFVRRKPATGPMPSSGIENGGSAEPRVPRRTEANAEAPHIRSTQATTPASPTSTPASPTSSPPRSPISPMAASSASRYRQKEK